MIYPFINTLREEEGEGSGGGSEPTTEDLINAAVQKAIEKEREAAKGLKAKNSELLGKLKQNQDVLTSLGGDEGIQRLKEFQDQVANDQALQLFTSGKREEYDNTITQRYNERWERKLNEMTEEKARIEAEKNNASQKLADYHLNDALSGLIGSTKPYGTSVPILIREAKQEGWTIGDDGDLELHDSNSNIVEKGKDAVTEWLTKKQEDLPQLWPGQSGSGAMSGSGAYTNGKLTPAQIANTSMAQYRKKRKEGLIG